MSVSDARLVPGREPTPLGTGEVRSDWWNNFPWREIQTNLREIDMRDIRAEQVVADLQAFKANVLMINAAGIIASYPTDLPFHWMTMWRHQNISPQMRISP